MVSVLTSRMLNRGFETGSSRTKDNTIGTCCFSTKHPSLRKKNKDCLSWNLDNMSLYHGSPLD